MSTTRKSIAHILPYFHNKNKALNIKIYEKLLPYTDAYAEQKRLHAQCSQNFVHEHSTTQHTSDYCLVLEHPPVYTYGRQNVQSDFLVSPEQLKASGAEIVQIDRGGKITYHGPGQIVLYCICNLGEQARNIRSFVHALENVILRYLADRWKINGSRRPEYPGIWVADHRSGNLAKIAAVGISIHTRTTMHGLAINLCPDLSYFNAIVACGIQGSVTCSVEGILQQRNASTGKHASGANINIKLNKAENEAPAAHALSKHIDLQQEKKALAHTFAETLGYARFTIQ